MFRLLLTTKSQGFRPDFFGVAVGQREDLEVLRAGLLESFADAEGSERAQLAREVRAVVKELAVLGEDVGEVSVADQLAAKRSTRRAGADDSASASRRGQPRRGGRSNRTG